MSSRSVRLKVRDGDGQASTFWLISAKSRALRVRSTWGVAKVGLVTCRFGTEMLR